MEIFPVCSEIPTRHINTVCGLNVKCHNVELGGTYINDGALQDWCYVEYIKLILFRVQTPHYEDWNIGKQLWSYLYVNEFLVIMVE
jgi:hypothetical protein